MPVPSATETQSLPSHYPDNRRSPPERISARRALWLPTGAARRAQPYVAAGNRRASWHRNLEVCRALAVSHAGSSFAPTLESNLLEQREALRGRPSIGESFGKGPTPMPIVEWG
jgi:hypothetical protein